MLFMHNRYKTNYLSLFQQVWQDKLLTLILNQPFYMQMEKHETASGTAHEILSKKSRLQRIYIVFYY